MKQWIGALVLAFAGITCAAAQPYPSRPITLVVPLGVGGSTDVIARTLAEPMRVVLGQPVVIENVTGANGNVGVGRVARAAPDGYTLAIGHNQTHVINAASMNLTYDVVKDFTHVCLIGHTPNVLIVPADSPYKSLADYLADAKAKPDQIAFGSSGIGSNTHLMGELLSSEAGIRLKHVPYKGSAPSLQDMLAGAIPSMFDPITTNVPHINSGKV